MTPEEERSAYSALLESTGMKAFEEALRPTFEDNSDLLPAKSGWKFYTEASPIHGKGTFARSDLKEGEQIAPARIFGKRTELGRYTNHGAFPNTKIVNERGDLVAYATTDIRRFDELLVDYRQVLSENIRSLNANVPSP